MESLVSLLARERDDDMPNLRLLIAEFFVSITMSLFSYAFAIFDSRWIYRLCAHQVDENVYGQLFGGGGEKRLRSTVPNRPPPPQRPTNMGSAGGAGAPAEPNDPSVIRAKLHAKVFGVEKSSGTSQPMLIGSSEQVVSLSCWVPPRKHVVQFYAEKVEPSVNIFGDYDSDRDDDEGEEGDDPSEDGDDLADPFDDSVGATRRGPRPHDDPNSYAWMLLRLTSVVHMQQRIVAFLQLTGFDLQDVPALSPRLDNLLKTISSWVEQLEEALVRCPEGCPDGFLRNSAVEAESATIQTSSLTRKYRWTIVVCS